MRLNRPTLLYLVAVPAAIGIPLCLDSRGRWREGRDYLYTDRAYARAIEAAGGLAIHLPLRANAAELLIERVDALLLPGGDDFAPPDGSAYPQDVAFDLAEPEQIEFDRRLLAAAVAAGKPVLGICYGMQLMALAAGGSLHHHVPSDVAGCLDHGGGAAGTTEHAIHLAPDSQLEGWIAGSAARVNSRHHQAVADPGELRVVASCPDGVIEAIESSTGGTAAALQLGVQWHPESLTGPAGAGLLRAFVAHAEHRTS